MDTWSGIAHTKAEAKIGSKGSPLSFELPCCCRSCCGCSCYCCRCCCCYVLACFAHTCSRIEAMITMFIYYIYLAIPAQSSVGRAKTITARDHVPKLTMLVRCKRDVHVLARALCPLVFMCRRVNTLSMLLRECIYRCLCMCVCVCLLALVFVRSSVIVCARAERVCVCMRVARMVNVHVSALTCACICLLLLVHVCVRAYPRICVFSPATSLACVCA